MDNPSSQYDKRLLNLTSCAFLNTYRRTDLHTLEQSLISQIGVPITTDPSHWDLTNSEYDKIYNLWKAANFNPDAIKWINYYPGQHFDQSLVDDIAAYLRVNVHRAWISRVDPGYFSPWHWDVDDNEAEYLQKGSPKRYSIIIGPPAMGHIFILGRDYLYGVPEGAIFKWNNYKEWHSGINAGLTPKFMLHLLAY